MDEGGRGTHCRSARWRAGWGESAAGYGRNARLSRVPFAWPVAGYPEYHTNGDDLHAVDPVDLENVSTAAAELVADLASLPVGRTH